MAIGTAAALIMGATGAMGLAGNAISSSAQSNALARAANLENAASQKSQDMIWQMYQAGQQQSAPYRAAGFNALRELEKLTYGKEKSDFAGIEKQQQAFDKQLAEGPLGRYGAGGYASDAPYASGGIFDIPQDKESSARSAELFGKSSQELVAAAQRGELTVEEAKTKLEQMYSSWRDQMLASGVNPTVVAQTLETQPAYKQALFALGNLAKFADPTTGKANSSKPMFWLDAPGRDLADKSNPMFPIASEADWVRKGSEKLDEVLFGAHGVQKAVEAGRLSPEEGKWWADRLLTQYGDWVKGNVRDQTIAAQAVSGANTLVSQRWAGLSASAAPAPQGPASSQAPASTPTANQAGRTAVRQQYGAQPARSEPIQTTVSSFQAAPQPQAQAQAQPALRYGRRSGFIGQARPAAAAPPSPQPQAAPPAVPPAGMVKPPGYEQFDESQLRQLARMGHSNLNSYLAQLDGGGNRA